MTWSLLLAFASPHFGWFDPQSALAAPGDVDLDGVPDLVVVGREPWSRRYDTGCEPVVWVLSGATGAAIHALRSPYDESGFGHDVDGAGDVNGDGAPDVIVGAEGPFGYALVFSGRDGELLLELRVPGPSGEFGGAVAGGGDLDGDGLADVVVGDPEHARIIAYSGASGLPLFEVDEVDEIEEGFWESGKGFGGALAIVPDVDGDARAEVLVGGARSGDVVLHSGADGRRLHVMNEERWASTSTVACAGDLDGDGISDCMASSPDRWLCAWSGRTGERLLRVELGGMQYARLGSSLATLGDLDDDGCTELVLGTDDSWIGDAGAARLHSGETWERVTILPGSDNGTDICGLGDVDGDGLHEVALFLRNSQIVRIVSGADLGVLREIDLLALGSDEADAPCSLGTEELAELGYDESGPPQGPRFAPAGDVDGDGVPDVLLANRWSWPWSGTTSPSVVWVLSGRDGAVLRELRPDRICVRFGSALHAAGDVDGDGLADLLVAADDHPYQTLDADGRSVTRRGVVFVVAGRDGRCLQRLVEPDGEAWFGTSLVGGEDLDGDDVPDVVVASTAHGGRGAVHVFSGATGALIRTLRREGDSGGLPWSARFGRVVALVPDADEDGLAEVAAWLAPGAFRLFSGGTGDALGTRYVSLGELRNSDVLAPACPPFGAWCAAGDLDGDGVVDVVLAPEYGGPVRALSGATGAELFEVTPGAGR